MNHDDNPNVSYSLIRDLCYIKFTVAKAIQPGDELCIYYGSKLWFPSRTNGVPQDSRTDQGPEIDAFPNFLPFQEETSASSSSREAPGLKAQAIAGGSTSESPASTSSPVYERGNKEQPRAAVDSKTRQISLNAKEDSAAKDVVPSALLPFERFKFPEEEDAESDDGPIPMSAFFPSQ